MFKVVTMNHLLLASCICTILGRPGGGGGDLGKRRGEEGGDGDGGVRKGGKEGER